MKTCLTCKEREYCPSTNPSNAHKCLSYVEECPAKYELTVGLFGYPKTQPVYDADSDVLDLKGRVNDNILCMLRNNRMPSGEYFIELTIEVRENGTTTYFDCDGGWCAVDLSTDTVEWLPEIEM